MLNMLKLLRNWVLCVWLGKGLLYKHCCGHLSVISRSVFGLWSAAGGYGAPGDVVIDSLGTAEPSGSQRTTDII